MKELKIKGFLSKFTSPIVQTVINALRYTYTPYRRAILSVVNRDTFEVQTTTPPGWTIVYDEAALTVTVIVPDTGSTNPVQVKVSYLFPSEFTISRNGQLLVASLSMQQWTGMFPFQAGTYTLTSNSVLNFLNFFSVAQMGL